MTQTQYIACLSIAQAEWDSRIDAYRTKIPDYTIEALQDYLFNGIPLGDFLRAVLRNDLWMSVGHADDQNEPALPWIVRLIYNVFPAVARNHSEWIAVSRRHRDPVWWEENDPSAH